MNLISPESTQACAEFVETARKEKKQVRVLGTGSRYSTSSTEILTSKKLDSTIFFHPEDMVVGVGAGMRISTLNAMLAEKSMHLPIDSYSPESTVGSVVASDDSGARKLFGGGIRDLVIGMEYINGKGKPVKGGGKVVKNVAGYDIPKMMIGSHGGLGMITQVNFKILPQVPIRKIGILQNTDASFLSKLRDLNRSFLPISALACLYTEKTFTLVVGYEGNQAKIERMEKDLRKIFGSDMSFTEEENLPDGFSGYHGARELRSRFAESGTNLCLQVFMDTSAACDTSFWKNAAEWSPSFLVHPFGADAWFFSLSEDSEAEKKYSQSISSVIPNGKYEIILHRSEGPKFPGCMNNGAHLLARKIKQQTDPDSVFYSPVFS